MYNTDITIVICESTGCKGENTMSGRNERLRDTSITLICHWCGNTFHPWNDHKNNNPSKYCSRNCRSRAALAKINGSGDIVLSPMPVRIAENIPPTENMQPTRENEEQLSLIDAEWRESGEHWDKVATWYAERQLAERKYIAQKEKDLAYTSAGNEGRTITLAGYGARLMVKRDCLVVVPGRTYSSQELETETLYRGIHGVSSIVWLTNGGDGSLSVSALKWCASQKITIRMLTNRGEHLATIHPSPDAPQALGVPNQENGRPDIKLRRAQYALAPSGKDIPLARAIILRKLAAQHKCLDLHPELPDREKGYAALDTAIRWLSLNPPTPATSNLDGIRLYEARAGNGYFMAWRGLSLQLDAKAAKNWPPAWKIIAERKSPLTRWLSPRQATNPAQAMLNFCYAMLESQVRAALYAIGADVVCGVLHSDRDIRDSLVFDVIEPLRGEVDHLLLEFINTHTFSAGDFDTALSGMVIIHPTLCKCLAQMVRVSQQRADEEAKWFKNWLLNPPIDNG